MNAYNESMVLDNRYFYTVLKSQLMGRQIDRAVFGSAQPQLTVRGINKFQIPVPPLPEQRAIAAALSDVDALVASLDKLIAKKHGIKQAAMQQLLTGKRRLPGFEYKAGFKHTEVGVIPEDWDARKIAEVCTVINGRGFKPHEWGTSGLPIIRIQNLNGSEDFNYYAGDFNSKIVVEKGQLLFAWSGSRGTSFGPHLWRGGRALLNYHTWKMVPDQSQVVTPYFFHALKSLTSHIEDKAHGASALVHTQKWEMEQFHIIVPPLPEQRSIATVISDMDAEIATLEARRDKTKLLKQGMMQELLTGRIRLI